MDLYEIITTLQDPQLADELDRFVVELLPEFKNVLQEHPLENPSSGCLSVTEAFWLYALAKSIAPDFLIESGTMEGYSLYFLWRAAAEQAKIFSFDPSPPKVRYPGVEYNQCDWTEKTFGLSNAKKSLIFFDDHIHQGKRLKEAVARGIKHVVFHDNYATSLQSHVPIRWCNLQGLATHCYTFDRLRGDPIFTDRSRNPQGYRWLTYVGVAPQTDIMTRTWRRIRYSMQRSNPYHVR
jgi:hypothetical protein